MLKSGNIQAFDYGTPEKNKEFYKQVTKLRNH